MRTVLGVIPLEALAMSSAPRDGKMIRLLIDYTDGGSSLEDEVKGWTIGFNNADTNPDDDRWQFVGWDWCQDVFCNGTGEPIGWLPWENPSVE